MEKPNWFDVAYGSILDSKSPHHALAEIAKNPRIVDAVTAAIEEHDKLSQQHGWMGPSRSQFVRKALAEVLNAD